MKRRPRVALLIIPVVLAVLVFAVIAAMQRIAPNPIISAAPLGVMYPTSPAVDESKGLAVLGGAQGMVMMDTRTGRMQRNVPIANGYAGMPVVDARAGRIYVPWTSGVYALDVRTGRWLWSSFLSLDPSALVVDARDDRVYAAWGGGTPCTNGSCTVEDGTLFALDGRTGHVEQTMRLPKTAEVQLALDASTHRLVILGGDPDGSGGAVSFVDARAGRLLHRAALPGPCSGFQQPPLVDAGRQRIVAICTSYPKDGKGTGPIQFPRFGLYVIDSRNGMIRFTARLASTPVALSVDASSGRFFVTDAGPTRSISVSLPGGGRFQAQEPRGTGAVQVRDTRSGALLHSWPAGILPTDVLADPHHGCVYVLNMGPLDPRTGVAAGAGTLTVLDRRSGRVRGTVAVGKDPQGMALDTRANRLVVVNAGDYVPVQPSDPWAWVPRWLRDRLPFLPRPASRPVRAPASVMVLDTSRL